MVEKNVYSGRVVFDHLPKTAGKAVTDWLIETLGSGCVSQTVDGSHADLIRKYGGLHSIICAHVTFERGQGLDPRYHYITLLRHPIDRVVSWLYFVLFNHDNSAEPELYLAAKTFLETDGLECSPQVAAHISDFYIDHFSAIHESGMGDRVRSVEAALSGLEKYSVVGIYENMPQFIKDVAQLLDVVVLKDLKKINVTRQRPGVIEISNRLRERIRGMNRLDIALYEQIYKQRTETQKVNSPVAKIADVFEWVKYEGLHAKQISSGAIRLVSVALPDGDSIQKGGLVTFDVEIDALESIAELEIGIHIFDAERRWAFGINSGLLGKNHACVSGKQYCAKYYLIADLPLGAYTAGFAFADVSTREKRELLWEDAVVNFRVEADVQRHFAGYSRLPAEIVFVPLARPRPGAIDEFTGAILPLCQFDSLPANGVANIDIEIFNLSARSWQGTVENPLSACYHWVDGEGNMVIFDGLRTTIPGAVESQHTHRMAMTISAPPFPGKYMLVLTLLQEGVRWFENFGFRVARLEVSVEAEVPASVGD